ncbi:hypothetical protein ACFLYR_05955 [Chloroflexota bacterium]
MDITWIAIITPIISALSALFGVWLTQRYESKKRESEERRWYADYFLGRKMTRLKTIALQLS